MSRPEIHRKEIVKLMRQAASSHGVWDVFRDFVELTALSIANTVDLVQAAEREKRYLQIVGRYDRADVDLFPRMLAELVDALEDPHDALGAVFGDLELGDAARGQFFTPYSVCQMMAKLTVGDGAELRALVERNGYTTMSEPSVGAGAQVIAFAQAMLEAGLNPQKHLHVTAVDVDARAAHMAFVQFSLLGIPAQVVVGNTLTLEQREVFYTPTHVLDGWSVRLRRQRGAPPPDPTPGSGDVPEAAADDAQLSLFSEAA